MRQFGSLRDFTIKLTLKNKKKIAVSIGCILFVLIFRRISLTNGYTLKGNKTILYSVIPVFDGLFFNLRNLLFQIFLFAGNLYRVKTFVLLLTGLDRV